MSRNSVEELAVELINNEAQKTMLVHIPLAVAGLATAYSLALGWLERRYPIRPDHIWAEVAGGVMISLVPITIGARTSRNVDWRVYENAVWRSFIASGTPIILWQLGEAITRHVELLRYVASTERRSDDPHADYTPSLANGSGE